MNSRLMIGLALIMLLAAGVAGYWGVNMSRQAEMRPAPVAAPIADRATDVQPAIKPLENRVSVVVLARDVPAYAALEAEDLAIEMLRLAPPDSFSAIEQVLDKKVWRDLPAGTVLNAASFDAGGPLAQMIRADERALAIAIDEVVGAGGHLRPGDYVDVLLFLRQDKQNGDRTMQVAVPALRVLSVGRDLGAKLSGEAAHDTATTAEQTQQRRDKARSAVLAVPELLLTRFALATEVGSLRLAVRSADEQRLTDYYAGRSREVEEINQQLFQFEKFALRRARRPQPGLVAPPPRGIEVYRGDSLSRELP